jgi:hypothetical protein
MAGRDHGGMSERRVPGPVAAGLGLLVALLVFGGRLRQRRRRGVRGEFGARWRGLGLSRSQVGGRQLLDELLRERFGLDSGSLPGIDQLNDDALVAAIGTFPSYGQANVHLSSDQSRLLDAAGFVDTPGDYSRTVSEMVLRTARLFSTGYSEEDVAAGFGADVSAVRDRRRKRTLWAIEHSGAWVYPLLQFRPGSFLEQLPGLDVVLPSLGEDLHPAAIAGFLEAPQTDLLVDGAARTVLEWLSGGHGVDRVLSLVRAQGLA